MMGHFAVGIRLGKLTESIPVNLNQKLQNRPSASHDLTRLDSGHAAILQVRLDSSLLDSVRLTGPQPKYTDGPITCTKEAEE